MSAESRFTKKDRLISRAVAAATILAMGQFALAQTFLDTIGLTQLRANDSTLNGNGVRVGQVEANYSMTGGYAFEANPASTGQPASLFSYSDQFGVISSAFNPSAESSHADDVGGYFYGASGGVAPGVSHVDNSSVDSFFNATVFFGEPIPDAVVNQSFTFASSNISAVAIANQQSADTSYDNYVAQYGTIFVSGVGNGSYIYPSAPSTSYNGIAVAADDGPSSSGPTEDNARSKPDISAPGYYTSFSTALVSGSAAILVQAGARGDGGTSPQIRGYAVDARTVKALLLNGADKTAVAFNRTHTSPLDANNGAGLLNIYNSHQQLAAGFFPSVSVAATGSLGGVHPIDSTSQSINSLAGWSFATLASSPVSDAYANYDFTLPTGVSSYTATATLVWERQYNNNPAIPLGINNLGLYLYDATTNHLIDYSVSAVDNVQNVFDQNLNPGDRYDLQVLKAGGIAGVTSGVVSNSETYALAFNFVAVPSVQGVWKNLSGGSVSTASNWIGSAPLNPTDSANFTNATTTAATITLNNNWVVGNIDFNNAQSYTIAPAATASLTLDNGGANAISTIADLGGSHVIAAPVQLNSQLAVSVANAADTLTISGNISNRAVGGSEGITLSGGGTLLLSGSNGYSGATTVMSGVLVISSATAIPVGGSILNNAALCIKAGTSNAPVLAGQITGAGALAIGSSSAPAYLQLKAGAGASSLKALTISVGSTLDITNNTLLINYGSAANDPTQTIKTYLASAYNNANWTGTGITSSIARQHRTVFSIGERDNTRTNQLTVALTVPGDVNLDGQVNFNDLLAIVQNLGSYQTSSNIVNWSTGDLNYDSQVNFNDLLILSQYVGDTLTGAESALLPASFQAQWNLALAETQFSDFAGPVPRPVPEPASVLTLLICGGCLLCRRRGSLAGLKKVAAAPGKKGGGRQEK